VRYLRQTYIKSTVNCAQLRERTLGVQQVAKLPMAEDRPTGGRASRTPRAVRIRVSPIDAGAHAYGAQPSFETLSSLER
jgi:hypothetical protein